MATIDQAIFELARRGYQWSKNSTLDDGVTSMLFDADPNTAVSGNTPGETKLVAMPIGGMFIQSSGTLWVKKVMPNTWAELSTASGTDHFSYDKIVAASTLTIPVNQQMIVMDTITVEGVLNIEGKLCLI